MIYATLGTVSERTLLTRDLLESFSYELESLFRKQSARWKRGKTRRIKKLLKEVREYLELDESADDYCTETGFELVQDLESELDYFSPEYVSFRTNDGDGADFGFFPDIESVQEGIRAGEILCQDDGARHSPACEVPRNYTGLYAHISDHGNLSLYRYTRGKSRYLWGVV